MNFQSTMRAESPERFEVTFLITVGDGQNVETLAREITLEQTVEVPLDCVPPQVLERGVVGQVEAIEPLPPRADQFRVVISYRCDNTAYSLPQFLNVLYGNISIKRGMKITGLELPDSLLEAFGGPQFGIEGIRKMTGVYDRPLACTALKPVGLSIAELTERVTDFARGGLDIIKEDHGMGDVVYHPFAERVPRFHEAISRANAQTGGHTLFLPMVSGGFEQIQDQFALVKELGIQGVLAAPLLVGMDTVRALARHYNLAVMAHPAFTGTHFHDPTHGMTPAVLLGTIFRLAGADISIFPNVGGRFGFSRQECNDLGQALTGPLGRLKPAFPAPAGGMKLDQVGSLVETYGRDCVLLIGGALLQYSPDLAYNAAAFVEAIKRASENKPSLQGYVK